MSHTSRWQVSRQRLRPLLRIVVLLSTLWVVFGRTPSVAQTPVDSGFGLESDISYHDSAEAGEDEYLSERCRLDVYWPTNERHFSTVVWFHGGGLHSGGKTVPEELKNQGLAVVAVNYRLSPRVKNPAYTRDAAAAVAWVFRNIEQYGGDPDSIFVAGHSAGGYLAAMVGLDRSLLAEHEVDADRIAGIFPYSGQAITHSTVRAERGIPRTRAIVDAFAPLYHVRGDAPPLILITGGRELDIPGRYEENALLWRMMETAGHPSSRLLELEGFDHGTMVAPAHLILLGTVRSIELARIESGKR